MKPKILLLNKPLGITPLGLIQVLKKQHPELADEKIGYAGRLDPMAEGLVLLLIGNENKARAKYLSLSKIYEAQILLGIHTDSYDLLGKIMNINQKMSLSDDQIRSSLLNFIGTHEQDFPPYSSKRVGGKPLFYYARNNIPVKNISKKITITAITNIEVIWKSTTEIVPEIITKLQTVTGNFRQEEIIEGWQKFSATFPDVHWPMVSATIACSSGTYIRSLAHDLGKKLEVGACLFGLKRTHIGEFSNPTANLWR